MILFPFGYYSPQGTQTPLEYYGSDLFAWYNSDRSIITKDGSNNVSQWNDLTTNNGHLQASGAEQPLWVDSVLNGKPVIKSDGVSELMTSALSSSNYNFLHDGSDYSVMCVFYIDSVGFTIFPVLSTFDGSSANIGANINFDDRASISREQTILHRACNASIGNPTIDNVSSDNAYNVETWSSYDIIGDLDNVTAADRSEVIVNDGGNYTNNSLTNAPSGSNPQHTLKVFGNDISSVYSRLWVAELLIVKRKFTPTDLTYNQNWRSSEWNL